MSATLSIEHMSIEEKLRAMELLWDELRERAEAETSPAWHGEELARREQDVAAGHDQPEDWKAAKHRIRDSLE